MKIGSYVDMEIEEFVTSVKTMPVEEQTDLFKQLDALYRNTAGKKDAVKLYVHEGEDKERVLNQLYIALQRIEDRISVIRELQQGDTQAGPKN